MTCATCGGRGFVWLLSLRWRRRHNSRCNRLGVALLDVVRERFRCPCDCAEGRYWAVSEKRRKPWPPADAVALLSWRGRPPTWHRTPG